MQDEAEPAPAAETSDISSAPLEDESYNGRVMDITFIRPKETLIIGSSIVRDIKAKRLQSTTVRSHSGARVNTIRHKIREMDLAPYNKIVLQVGGNDISNRRPVRRVMEDYNALITEIREKTDGRADVFVSGIPPRVDVNVVHLNNALEDLCEAHNVTFIKQLDSFIDSYGYVKLNLYQLDDLHLSNRGTVQLLYNINRFVPILRHKQSENNKSYCANCGEENHVTEKCKYGKSVRCHNCHRDGHKKKLCHPYN